MAYVLQQRGLQQQYRHTHTHLRVQPVGARPAVQPAQDNKWYTSFTLSNSKTVPFTYSFGDSNTVYNIAWNSNLTLSINGSNIVSANNYLQPGSNVIEVKGRLGNVTVYNNASNVLQSSNADWSWGMGGYASFTASNPTNSNSTFTVQGYQNTAIYTVLDHVEFTGDGLFDGTIYASNVHRSQAQWEHLRNCLQVHCRAKRLLVGARWLLVMAHSHISASNYHSIYNWRNMGFGQSH